jgi:hypothetical protein
VGAGQDLLLLQEVGVTGVHPRQQRQALQLVFQDLEVVAQRERPVLREQLLLGDQLAAHAAARLIDGGAAGQADRQRQQRRQNQGELGPQGQRFRAETLALLPPASENGPASGIRRPSRNPRPAGHLWKVKGI